jgi:hypothetical protein
MDSFLENNMKQEITIANRKYKVDLDKAIKAGVIEPIPRTLTVADVKDGEVFKFITEDGKSTALFIKHGDGIDRIAGTNELKTKIGEINRNVWFPSTCEVSIYRKGVYVTEQSF